ncbi:MAG: hypothetical protein EOP05_06660, partial [Proteobacteria bacterium]
MSSDISSLRLNNLASSSVDSRANAGDFIVWLGGCLAAGFWTSSIVSILISKFEKLGRQDIQVLVLKNSGLTALALSTTLIAILCLSAAVMALRGKKMAQPSASVVVIAAMALRAIQLFYQGQASTLDADILAGLLMIAGLLYFGSSRLWWGVLMPLGTLACFVPLIWLEFFKGATHASLVRSLVTPATAFGLTSILIVSRELRARAQFSLTEMSKMQTRGVNLKKQMHAMETDLKSLLTMISISRPAVLVSPNEILENGSLASVASADSTSSKVISDFEADVIAKPLEELGESSFTPAETGPLVTTEFVPESIAMLAPESSSYEDLDRAAREVLDEARAKTEG